MADEDKKDGEDKQMKIPGTEQLDKLKAEADAAREEVERLKAAEKDRKRKEKEKADQDAASKAVTDGNAKAELDRLAAEKAAAEKELEELRALESKRLDSVIEAMPQESRDMLKKHREKMGLADFAELVSDHAKMLGTKADDDKKKAPPAATPGGQVVKTHGRELEPDSEKMLKDFNVDPDVGRRLDVTEVDGGRLFGQSVHDFLETLRMKGEAAKRHERFEWPKLGEKVGRQ